MDNRERATIWLNGFYAYVSKENIELLPLFHGRLTFNPNPNDENIINPGLLELDEHYATEDQIKRMWQLFADYASDNQV